MEPGRTALRPVIARLVNRVVLVRVLNGYKNYNSCEIHLDPPVRFAVEPFDERHDITSNEHFLDTYLNVHPLQADPRLEGYSSFYILGPSYDYNTDKVDMGSEWTETGEPVQLPDFIDYTAV